MQPDFLNVASSLTGRRWQGPSAMEDRAAEALVQASGVPPALARVLARNGVQPAEVPAYLEPRLRDLMPDPRGLKDMEAAAGRLNRAVHKSERVAVFADYDVDGGASAALLIRWLRDLGRNATLYVPDRMTEGYGPNVPAMEMLAAGHDLIVCVDCGTLSHEAIAASRSADVVVIDHHLGGATLPPAFAVVNPNRQDEDRSLGMLCAAGVAFLALVEANRQRREAGEETPDLMGLLDLVALATVADVAPLTGLNRALVRQGLAVMAQRRRPGLVALGDIARLNEAPTPYHLGFVLGPRINAGGRLGMSDLGARLLITDDPGEAANLAATLDRLNSERRDIESRVREEALAQIDARGPARALAWAAGKDWHPGVLGIVAARIKEATSRPSIVLSIDGGEAKGSGRSVAGMDLGTAVQRLADEGLIERGGGHAMAAGLSLSAAQIPQAMERLDALMSRQGSDPEAGTVLKIDGMLMSGAATADLLQAVATAGPFGAGNPAPRFAFPDQRIGFAKKIGNAHLKFSFADSGQKGPAIDGIAFNAFDGPLGQALISARGQSFHLAGQLELNHWQGRARVQLRLEDAAKP